MLRSHVALALLAGGLAMTGVANACHEDGVVSPYSNGYYSNGNGYHSLANNLYVFPTMSSASCSCHKVGPKYHRYWRCGMTAVKYSCVRTVTTVNPIHRDTYCAEWAMLKGVSGHYYKGEYVYR